MDEIRKVRVVVIVNPTMRKSLATAQFFCAINFFSYFLKKYPGDARE